MSKPKRRAPAAPAKNPILDNEEKEETPQTEKTMDDLPPEVLTTIPEHAILNEPRNHVLVYRNVSSQWKEIVDSLLEKEVISRRLEAFPEMKIGGQSDQLSVYCPRTIFRPGGNPLSFNSLLLEGHEHFRQGPTDTQMAFPIFMSKFGSNLTTFVLQNQIIGTKSLAAMLRTMNSLKVLCLEDVELTRRSIGPGGILQPPSLPSLSTLKLKSELFDDDDDQKINPLYVWLVASYADQLVHLCLDTSAPFPALQKETEYSIPWRRGENVSIATTSGSAFGKLKELHIYHPSPQFLRLTETPALRHLSVKCWRDIDLRDLKKMIVTCGSSLQEVSLDIDRDALVNREGIQNIPTTRVMARNVKMLTVCFSDDDKNETLIDRALLSMFPGLKRIQLLFYNLCRLYWEIAGYESQCQHQGANQLVSKMNEGDRADEIIALKRRLLPLLEQKAVLVMRYRDPAEIEVRDQIYEAIIELRNARAVIFKRLVALGENANKVIVEQMLERQGAWNTCPDLKIVSVSWGREPVGDVCLIRRMDDA